LWLSGFLERDLSFFLETVEKSIALAALPPPANLALTNYLESASVAARRRYCILSAMLLPAFSRIAPRDAYAVAQMRTAATALALERFRGTQGRLPNQMDELVPQYLDSVPADPFDGAALRYRRLARCFVVYSVGADGHDDDGREMPEHRKPTDKTSYDITFIVER
jgi:hypothetical protein